MRFSSPYLLVLFAFVVWFCWRARASAGIGALAWRGVIAALLVLSASGLQIRGGLAPLSVMFVLDRSASMADPESMQLARLRALAVNMQPDDRAGLIVFGSTPVLEGALDRRFAPAAISAMTPRSGTDIEAALRAARASLAHAASPRIVLLSDGRQTRGNALSEATRAASENMPVDVVLPDAAEGAAPRVVRLQAPNLVRTGEPFVLRAVVAGAPGTRARVMLESDGRSREQVVVLSALGMATASFPDRSPRTGVRVYRAMAGRPEADALSDFVDRQGAAGAIVTVSGRPRVLYVAHSMSELERRIASVFDVDRMRPEALPRTAEGLDSYDAVVVDDVGGDDVDAERATALAGYVEQYGGGLLVLGSLRSLDASLGENSFGSILPIDLRPRSGGRSPDFALVVVVDKSGSMDDRVAGALKIDFARQAIARALQSISTTDEVGVIAFDSVAVPMAPLRAGHDPAAIGGRLRNLVPAGSTAIAPAMELAREWLTSSTVEDPARRHVLLISDGSTTSADRDRLSALVARGGFTMSAVALGAGSDRDLLESLARESGGRAFFPEDIREVPTLVAREVARVSGGRVVETPFAVRASSHAVLAGVSMSALPMLGGYVVSTARPTADTILRSHLDDPILAAWQAGLGRVGVYTADLASTWSVGLRNWSDFDRLFLQTVRWLSRSVEQESMSMQVRPEDDGVRVLVDASSRTGEPIDLGNVKATLSHATGAVEELRFGGLRPGRFEAVVRGLETGPHVVAVEATSRDGRTERRIVRAFYYSSERERQLPGTDRSLLLQIARTTGGVVLAPGDSVFADAHRRPDDRALRPWLALAALLLFLVELVARATRVGGRFTRSGVALRVVREPAA
jgi:Mg-chelatase subunit ChlD